MEAKMQSDVERLKKLLEDAPHEPDFLARYVRELELLRSEEDIFIRLAFENAQDGGALGRISSVIVSPFSQLYKPLDPETKNEIRRWWHQKVRGEAEKLDALRVRLSNLPQ